MHAPSSFIAVSLLCLACGPGTEAEAPRSAAANQWLTRAKASLRAGDFEDASESSRRAILTAPKDDEVRILGAKIALTELNYDDAIRLASGLPQSEARRLLARALWYKGSYETCADVLEGLLQDPTVKDPWVNQVAKLARRAHGRTPFAMEGGYIAAVEIPRQIGDAMVMPLNVVPIELEGEQVLAVVSTGVSELVIDSTTRKEPEWVSVRFDRIEVRDVPALTQDLAALSRQVRIPIRALIGTNFLRHLNATIDRRGDQFVVRREEAHAPPEASRIGLWYPLGATIAMRASVSKNDADASSFLVNTQLPLSLGLTTQEWKKAGFEQKALAEVPGTDGLRTGTLKSFRFAGFDLGGLPAFSGVPVDDKFGIDFGGVIGSDLLMNFRITLGNEGRFAWIEPDPSMANPHPPATASPSDPGREPKP